MKRVFYGDSRSFYRGEPRETDVASGISPPLFPPPPPSARVSRAPRRKSLSSGFRGRACASFLPAFFLRSSTFDPLMRLIRNFISRKKPCLWGSATCVRVCVYIYVKLPCTVIFPLLRDTFPRGARCFRRTTGGWCVSLLPAMKIYLLWGESFDFVVFDTRFLIVPSIWRDKFSRLVAKLILQLACRIFIVYLDERFSFLVLELWFFFTKNSEKNIQFLFVALHCILGLEMGLLKEWEKFEKKFERMLSMNRSLLTLWRKRL